MGAVGGNNGDGDQLRSVGVLRQWWASAQWCGEVASRVPGGQWARLMGANARGGGVTCARG
jgi:hypothetical protein